LWSVDSPTFFPFLPATRREANVLPVIASPALNAVCGFKSAPEFMFSNLLDDSAIHFSELGLLVAAILPM
jgi:hypothetical protein